MIMDRLDGMMASQVRVSANLAMLGNNGEALDFRPGP